MTLQLRYTTTTATSSTTTALHYTNYTTPVHFKYNYNCTTLHITTLITLHYNYSYSYTTLDYTILHYTTPHSLHYNYSYNYTYTISDYTTLHFTTLQHATLHYSTQHYTTLHFTTLHCVLNYNYTTPPYIQQLWVRWPLQQLQLLQKHNSNHLSAHQWIRSATGDSQQQTSPIGLLSLKLLPPPCAVLLVISNLGV